MLKHLLAKAELEKARLKKLAERSFFLAPASRLRAVDYHQTTPGAS